MAQDRQKAEDALNLEKQRARYTLILQAIGTGDPTIAEQNIKFFINAGLLDDKGHQIALALEKIRPVLPSSGGALRIARGGIFRIGPLTIEVEVTGTVPDESGKPSVPVGHNEAALVLEISNAATVPIDVEISVDLTANLLVFASGGTWTKRLNSVAPFTGAASPSIIVREPLSRPIDKGSGSETVRVAAVRYRNTGVPGWMHWHYPSVGGTVTLSVPPSSALSENGSIRAGRQS